jgi:hypothetical protein
VQSGAIDNRVVQGHRQHSPNLRSRTRIRARRDVEGEWSHGQRLEFLREAIAAEWWLTTHIWRDYSHCGYILTAHSQGWATAELAAWPLTLNPSPVRIMER